MNHVFLTPGTLHCAENGTIITTVLGSCVAICLWDCAVQRGGMNHFVLPNNSPGEAGLRYGSHCTDELVKGMRELGCEQASLQAKVFGGAAVLSGGSEEKSVGAQNVGFALRYLKECGIPIIARKTGGTRGLWIQQATQTGDVMVRVLDAA